MTVPTAHRRSEADMNRKSISISLCALALLVSAPYDEAAQAASSRACDAYARDNARNASPIRGRRASADDPDRGRWSWGGASNSRARRTVLREIFNRVAMPEIDSPDCRSSTISRHSSAFTVSSLLHAGICERCHCSIMSRPDRVVKI